MKELELENEMYVDGLLKDDIEAFCHVSEKYMYYVTKFQGIKNGYKTFNVPAFLLGGAWFAHRGLMKEAFLTDMLGWVFTGSLQVIWEMVLGKEEGGLWVAIIGMLIYAIVFGIKATPYYFGYTKTYFEKMGFLNRKPEAVSEATNQKVKEILYEAGKTSGKRTVLHFIFFKVLGKLCWISLWITIYAGSGVRFY